MVRPADSGPVSKSLVMTEPIPDRLFRCLTITSRGRDGRRLVVELLLELEEKVKVAPRAHNRRTGNDGVKYQAESEEKDCVSGVRWKVDINAAP